ncbi:MAG: ATP-dependent helicase [Lachnospiraceae bacterium]|nr:ATP-dependent helicase [Lachnospiraceae bacterium]
MRQKPCGSCRISRSTVFVIGLQEGILPGKRAVTLSEIEEERRLLYVAMTRARTRLFLLARGSTERSKRYSPFVEEIRL